MNSCTHHWTVTSECPYCLRAEIERLRKIETAAQLALGLLWMVEHRGPKVRAAFYSLRDAFGGAGSNGLGAAIQAAIDAGYEADHPPSADWWAGKKGEA